MKKNLLLLSACILVRICSSQVILTPADTTINPPDKVNMMKYYRVSVQFTLKKPIREKDTFLIVSFDNIIPLHKVNASLPNERLAISKKETEALNKGEHLQKTILLEISLADELSKDEFIYISVGDSRPSLVVRVSRFGMYDPSKSFWVEVGANFDLVDGLQPNNLFSGVFLYKRDIRPLTFKKIKEKKTSDDNLAIFAGVYESKTISESFTKDVGLLTHYNNASLELRDKNKNYGVFRDIGKVKSTQVIRNVGLFFSPQLRLTNGCANEPGLHAFASLWIELQWQRILSNVDSLNLTRLDTIYVPIDSLSKHTLKSFNQELDVRSHYFGFGFPIFYKEGDVQVFFNPVIGLSNQPAAQILDHLQQNSLFTRAWNPFYIFQFRLNEEKYGISFTGEARGLIKEGSRPFVSLALSKKFDLTRLVEY